MSKLNGHFGGYVKSMSDDAAMIEIDNVFQAGDVQKGDLVKVFKTDFAAQMPGVAVGGYVEGNVVRSVKDSEYRFINVTRIV